MKKRIPWRPVVFAVAVLAAGALQYYGKQHDQGVAESDGIAPTDAAISASSTPTPLPTRHWQFGTLDLESCELPARNSGASTAAWCADYDVAENPEQPDGRHIKLHLAVVRAQADQADPDLVVMLAGGPGEAATESFANTQSYSDVLKHHNVLLLDQRGTGHSHPLLCDKAAEAAKARGQGSEGTSDTDAQRERVASCLKEVGENADPRYYTTTIAVGDLETVRQALGGAQLDLIGVSYGTRMAQQYLKRHPDAVRSVVLDSPVPNPLILVTDWAGNLESALKQIFDGCVATPACRQAYGDPMRTLRELRAGLRGNPHEVSFRDPGTYETVSQRLTEIALARVVRLFAYSPETAALLPLTIDAAARGKLGPLLGQDRLLTQDLSNALDNAMAMSVICSEDADQVQERSEDADTVLGNLLVDSLKAQCSVWPHGAMPEDFHSQLVSDKPVLILSGALDPVTPPRYGAEIARGLSRARQLVLAGQGHGISIRGCMPKLVAQFIDDPQPERLDTRCAERLGPIPAFVDFNGATP
jgi:pimeloyl-ACP methyl ester carboxylesterase